MITFCLSACNWDNPTQGWNNHLFFAVCLQCTCSWGSWVSSRAAMCIHVSAVVCGMCMILCKCYGPTGFLMRLKSPPRSAVVAETAWHPDMGLPVLWYIKKRHTNKYTSVEECTDGSAKIHTHTCADTHTYTKMYISVKTRQGIERLYKLTPSLHNFLKHDILLSSAMRLLCSRR